MTEGASSQSADGAGQVGTASATADELARLRAERDAALAELSAYKQRSSLGGRSRGVGVWLLVVLFAILMPITTTATWAHRTVLNTDSWVRTVAPIAADPAVTAAVSKQITDQLYEALDPQSQIAAVLPADAAFLAGPIAYGMKGTIQSAVNDILDSEEFQQLWASANRFAHGQLVAVLRGENAVLQTTDNQVVLNLVPVLAAAVEQVEQLISGVVGRPVSLPTISGDELPSVACEKIAAALGRPVPSTCGQIVLFPAEQLSDAQRLVRAFDRLTFALLVITPLLAFGAVWLSQRRRRTVLQLAVAGAIAVVVGRRLVMLTQDQLISGAAPENREVRAAVVRDVLDGYFGVTGWLLFGALLVAAAALLTGPYQWAASTRAAAVGLAKPVGRFLSGGDSSAAPEAPVSVAVAWVRRHLEVLQVAGIVLGALVLLVIDVTFWWMVIVLSVVGVYEVWLYQMRGESAVVEGPPDVPGVAADLPSRDD